MKKNNEKGFFLSETMVVIAIVVVVLLGVFKLFSSVYYSFVESENYNTANAINALSNIQKYYESKGSIDTSLITEEVSYVDLTNLENYASDYYDRLKEEFKIGNIYLIDLNKIYLSNEINKFYHSFRKYLNTLKNVQGIVLVVALNENEYAYTQIENYQTVTLIGDEEDEFVVYVPIGGEFTDPGYKNWNGEEPTITWENDNELNVNKAGTYYKYYDFNGYLLRRKIVVGDSNATAYIKKLLMQEETLNNGLFMDDTVDKNIRYRGSNPNNYVYFNCEDTDGNKINYGENNYNYSTSCEVWRIVGVFDVDNGNGGIEKRVKLVREAFTDVDGNLIKMSFDSSANDVNSGYGINQWGESAYEDGTFYEGADLKKLLNGYYIGKEGSICTYCNGENQETCLNDCTSSVTPLSSCSLSMIEEARWNTGAIAWAKSITVKKLYESERLSISGKICKASSIYNEKYRCTDQVVRTTSWIGMVGLINASDFGYASNDATCTNDVINEDSNCKNNNWFNLMNFTDWTFSSVAESSRADLVLNMSSLYNNTGAKAYSTAGIRPSLYLKSSVEIVSGSGTTESPYILK